MEAADAYGTAADRYNRVEFRPVTARALRLVVQLRPEKSAGISEWRVGRFEGAAARRGNGR